MGGEFKDLAMSLAKGLDVECKLNRRDLKDPEESLPEEEWEPRIPKHPDDRPGWRGRM